MKRFLIWLIKKYQNTPLSSHSMCKFIPTCSNYAITAINEYGSLKGSYMSLKRIIRCNPFSKGRIDLVPIKEKK